MFACAKAIVVTAAWFESAHFEVHAVRKDCLGTRQAGLPDFRVANLLRDARILDEAHQDAFELANTPGFLASPEYEEVRQELKKRWGGRLELVNAG